jgi:plastocyanin
VAIRCNSFEPQALEITAGATVQWTNYDAVPHTVTYAGGPARFDCGTLERNQFCRVQFTVRGSFAYFSNDRPNTMKGTLVVR